MMGMMMFGVVVIFSLMNFYKNRRLFKQLSRREWVQYVAGFLLAWVAAVGVIISGSALTDMIQIPWLSKGLAILSLLIGCTLAGCIMNKALPEKLRQFYA